MEAAPSRCPPLWTAELTPNCFIVRDANGQALSCVFSILSADLSMTPPFHASGEPAAVIRQDQSKCVGDSVRVSDCEADAGSRKIENSAPPKGRTLYSNPCIIVVRATGCPAIFVIVESGAQTASDAESQATLMLTPDQSLLHYFRV